MIRWSGVFLQRMMEKLRFHEHWIELVMKCITLVSYSIVLMVVKENCFGLHEGYDKVIL